MYILQINITKTQFPKIEQILFSMNHVIYATYINYAACKIRWQIQSQIGSTIYFRLISEQHISYDILNVVRNFTHKLFDYICKLHNTSKILYVLSGTCAPRTPGVIV